MEPCDPFLVDHKDGDRLNNCKSNLRLATKSENGINARKPLNQSPTSQYKGVSYGKDQRGSRKWKASTRLKGQQLLIGRFATELEAARAYDHAVHRIHGPFARLNFPVNDGTTAS